MGAWRGLVGRVDRAGFGWGFAFVGLAFAAILLVLPAWDAPELAYGVVLVAMCLAGLTYGVLVLSAGMRRRRDWDHRMKDLGFRPVDVPVQVRTLYRAYGKESGGRLLVAELLPDTPRKVSLTLRDEWDEFARRTVDYDPPEAFRDALEAGFVGTVPSREPPALPPEPLRTALRRGMRIMQGLAFLGFVGSFLAPSRGSHWASAAVGGVATLGVLALWVWWGRSAKVAGDSGRQA